MTDERAKRRLAAILAADVVGYSRLMQLDEAGTLAALKSRRTGILQPVVSSYRGRIGGLVPLALALRCPEAGHRMTRRFSMLASSAVVLVVVKGTGNGWLLVETPQDLMTTTYGQLLSIKVILVALMVSLAMLNRFWIVPGFARDAARTRRYLRLSIGLELTLALLVLILVAVFGTLPPPEHNTAGAVLPE